MFELALQVIRRRWLLSASVVFLMVLTLLNTTATLGLASYVVTGYTRAIDQKIYKASFYHPGTLPEAVVESRIEAVNLYGFSPYWQAYGFSRQFAREAGPSFTFLPLKVVTYAPSWRLPLVAGSLPKRPTDLLVNQYFASAYGFELGDSVAFGGYGKLATYQVVGILADAQYETRHMDHQRVFVGGLSPLDQFTGMAFDIKASDHKVQALLEDYSSQYGRPFVAEYYSVDHFKLLQKRPQFLTLAISLFMWFVQFLLIVYLILVVMRQLVRSYPHSMAIQGRTRLDHLDVYLNYFMLLLGLAFVASVLVLRPYLLNLTAALELDISALGGWRLFLIHGIGLGFWMNVMVVINAFIQRVYVKQRESKHWYEERFDTKPVPLKLLGGVMGLFTVNLLLAVLLLVSFEATRISSELLKHPSIWGFPNQTVSLNVDKSEAHEAYGFHPIVIEGASPIYATGVSSPSGMEAFDIQLVSGRMPRHESEVVVGLGLVDEPEDLGERIRFYSPDGVAHEAVIVGIGIAAFSEGKLLGYLSPYEPTFLYDGGQGPFVVDYKRSVPRHYAHVAESVAGFIVPLVSSMMILGLGVLVVFYGGLDMILHPYRKAYKILRGSWLGTMVMVAGFALVMSALCLLVGLGLWELALMPAVNHFTTPLGIDLAHLTRGMANLWRVGALLALVNGVIGAIYLASDTKLWGNGFLDR